MDLSFLFWNLDQKPLWDRLANMVLRHHVDLVMLAECPEKPTEVCRLLGERTSKPFYAAPAGSYYYRKSTPVSYFWNIFDQVLLRPEIMHWLIDLRILDHDGSASLLDHRGIPDSRAGSDHLPLYFRLHP